MKYQSAGQTDGHYELKENNPADFFSLLFASHGIYEMKKMNLLFFLARSLSMPSRPN